MQEWQQLQKTKSDVTIRH